MKLLGMLAKHWAPGEVKSRLAKVVGPKAASQLYLGFLRMLIVRFAATADQRVLVYSPTTRRAEFEELLLDTLPLSGCDPVGSKALQCLEEWHEPQPLDSAESAPSPAGAFWSLEPQAEGDLGARMRAFFEWAFASGATRVVLIGSDSPTLPIPFVEEAFAALAQHPVVLGPTLDGGYYLVGADCQSVGEAVLRPAASVPPIFERIDWSTSAVFEQTVERLRAAGLPYHVLPPWYDVDELADLARLKQELDAKSGASTLDCN
jgi:rSAM/selenodomain-associated transferase 1